MTAMPAVLRCERGTGSVLALAILLAVVAVTAGGLGLAGAGAARARAAAAADLAAVAAADTASGRVAGVPCEAARSVAHGNGAELASCELSGAVIDVTASVPYLGLMASAAARAGPPGSR
jgi:secretion/DNA translocation related TadE-like protein